MQRKPDFYKWADGARDPGRIHRIMAEIEACWCKFPDLRLGQLIANICRGDYEADYLRTGADVALGAWLSRIFNIEDDALIESIENTERQMRDEEKVIDKVFGTLKPKD